MLILSKMRHVRGGFTSEEGHFSPLEEGVKHLPNLHILHFIFEIQKTADFRIISFPAHKSKEDLHFSEVLYVVLI